jgi:hypothetical protein
MGGSQVWEQLRQSVGYKENGYGSYRDAIIPLNVGEFQGLCRLRESKINPRINPLKVCLVYSQRCIDCTIGSLRFSQPLYYSVDLNEVPLAPSGPMNIH